ncbi:hypothetical protein [Chryseobacterium sp. MP_3.2]|uniref:hypothetical protein n=1 Tax=Chryseobacterium sp. MP_3.2 TaxID=3071712 RepID=UPI002DF88DB4|nr:hypothetical protein [Chryseobacterium sp. MP_3.2]
MTKSLEQINRWLLENQGYYDSIKFIRPLRCEDCEENNYPLRTGPNCKHRIYAKEYEFFNYFNSLVTFLETFEVNKKCLPLLQMYDDLPSNDSKALDAWCSKLLEFEEENLTTFILSDLKVLDAEGKIIGVKPNLTKLYSNDPFVVPVEGFENLLRIHKLFHEHFTIQNNLNL